MSALITVASDAPAVRASTLDADAGRAARGAAWFATSAIAVKGLQTIVLLIAAAVLAPSALGLLSLGAMVTNVAQTFADLGTAIGLVYWRGDERRAARTSLTLTAAASLLVAAAVWVAAPWLADALRAGPDAEWVIRALISVLPCYGLASVPQELLRRRMSFARRIVPDVASATVGGALSIWLVLAGHGLAGVVIGQVVQGVLTPVLTWLVGSFVVPGWNAGDARGLLRYGGHITAGGALRLIVLNVDYVAVSRVLGPTALGRYSLAFRLAYLPYLNIAFVIAGAAFPYLCRLTGVDVGRATTRILASSMTLLAPVCTGIALFADQLTLLGARWQGAIPAVRWLSLWAALLSLAYFLQIALNSVGRPRSTMLLQLLHLAGLVAALLLLTRDGIRAVAIGRVGAAALAALGAVHLARRQVPGFSGRQLVPALGPAALGSACMAAVTLVAHRVWPGSVVSLTGLFVVGAAALAAYVLPVVLVGRPNLTDTVRLIGRRP